MGRRTSKRIPRSVEPEKELFDEENDQVFSEMEKSNMEYERLDKIMEVRKAMLKYRRDAYMPLCEFLTPEIMMSFVDWVEKM